MHSPDITQENVVKLLKLFPNCKTEKHNEKDELETGIDFDLLKQELSKNIVEGPKERYQLNWPGKREALLTANTSVAKTLRPCRKESVNFDSTKNLFIEGDNLDALKLLQENYLGKVKMIYIDPPYNTGRDFIYRDKFAQSSEDYLSDSGQKDEEGNRLITNTESNGRFHSDWLSMMYPRLKLARNLLRDDGVIFISIDDNEVHNLRRLNDEIFGDNNFLAKLIWKKRNTPPNDKTIAAQHEYILCIVKNNNLSRINLRQRTEKQMSRYKNPDSHPKGLWVAGDLTANVKGGRYVSSLNFPIINPYTGKEYYPPSNGNWRFNKEKINKLIENNEIYFGENNQGKPKLKRFLCDVKEGTAWTTLWDFVPFNSTASAEMTNILGNLAIFENPKPTGLIIEILKAGSSKNGIVLDFFSGSATTAHATMQLNAEDSGNRQFIMVQLPEQCGEKSEAFKAGYKTIAEISKERIRRAGTKIKQENPNAKDLDIGFRVLKVDSSNMNDVSYTPDKTHQADMFARIEHIKKDRSDEDLLFQVMLDWGLELTLPVRKETILKKTVYFVGDDELIACFAKKNITEELIKELATFKPLRIVFRDDGFVSDSVKINAEQIFKQLASDTDFKVI